MTLRDQIKEMADSTTSKVRLTALMEVLALMDKLPPDEPCRWRYDEDDFWGTGCGEAFVFMDGGPAENRVAFCPYCGRPLEIIEANEEEAP